MSTEATRVVVGTLLYSIKFDKLDDTLVDRRARALVEEPLIDLLPSDEYQAIVEGLQLNTELTELIQLPEAIAAHGEQDFRDFLRRLVDRLDAMRPWPEPLHREVSDSRWTNYTGARTVGRIKMDYVDAQQRINYGFRCLMSNGRKLRVVILRLRSGDEVALVAPWWPNSEDVAILSRDVSRLPEDILDAFLDATNFTQEEAAPLLHQGDTPKHPSAK